MNKFEHFQEDQKGRPGPLHRGTGQYCVCAEVGLGALVGRRWVLGCVERLTPLCEYINKNKGWAVTDGTEALHGETELCTGWRNETGALCCWRANAEALYRDVGPLCTHNQDKSWALTDGTEALLTGAGPYRWTGVFCWYKVQGLGICTESNPSVNITCKFRMPDLRLDLSGYNQNMFQNKSNSTCCS